MAKKRILILGAGLAGLSAAWHLQRKGIDCRVFEKESEVGGLCRSKRINGFTPPFPTTKRRSEVERAGFTFDYDGHLLHFKHQYTFKLIKSLLRDNLIEHKRNSWVYSYGRYSRYPFQANLYGLPPRIIKECLLGFIEASKDGYPKNTATFLDWINQTFGEGIAKHFMIPYNTKFWTVSPQKLTCEWFDGFIPVPSLSQMIEGTIIEDNKRQFGYNTRFWYPKRGGINQVALALAGQIKNIQTKCEIIKIDCDKKEIRLSCRNKERFDYLISTIPLPELPHLIKGLPYEVISLVKKLRWNSILNLNLALERVDCLKRHWIYFPQEKICFFRVGFYHNFSPNLTPQNMSSLYIEVAYSKEKPIDKNKIALDIIEDLKKVGILSQEKRIYVKDINDIKYAYPIYDNNYQKSREKILKFLVQNNIIPCGRYGSWRYMSMEDVILDGKDVAGRVLNMV